MHGSAEFGVKTAAIAGFAVDLTPT